MRVLGLLAALAAALVSTAAQAQMDQAIPASALVDPWIAAKAVVVTLPNLFDHLGEAEQRSALDRKLGELDDRLAELVSRQEAVAISIASNPSFVYDAPASSDRMSAQVIEIEQTFDALFGDLKVRERPDVRAAQASLNALRRLLSDKNALEHDVMNAVASGSRNLIQALAGRWWAGAESVRDVRDALIEVRRRLSALLPAGSDPPYASAPDRQRL